MGECRMAKSAQITGLDGMMTSSEAAQRIGSGEYEEEQPISREVMLSDQPGARRRQRRMPHLRILQDTSDAVKQKQGSAGQLAIPNFPAIDAVTLVPLRSGDYREYRVGAGKSAIVKCFSHDGVKGEGDPGILCAECSLKEWGPKNPATGRSTKPPCTEGVRIAFMSLEYRCPVLYSFKGKDMQLADSILDRADFSGFGRFAVKMYSQSTGNNLGTWHAPRIEFLLEIPEELEALTAKALTSIPGSPEPEEDVIDVIST